MRFLTLLTSSLLSVLSLAHATPGSLPPPPIFGPHDPLQTLLKSLSPNTRSSALTPSSPAWQNATLRNNPLVPPALQLILTPSSVKEVEKIVTFANQYRIVLHPTVSTHGFTKTLTRATPGIQINLTKFNSIRLISKETIEIGGGITAKEVIDFLFKQNLRATTPGCDCISFLGPALGGGTGTYEGIYGLIGDGLVSVDIVTAKGTFRASAKENKELFWALKGAGHNFGIVTSARVRVHPIDKKVDGNEWLDAIFSYEATPSKILQVVTFLDKWRSTQPKEVSLFISFWHPAGSNSTPTLDVELMSFGLPRYDKALLAAFTSLGPLSEPAVQRIPWNTLADATYVGLESGACAKGGEKGRGTFAAQISALHPRTVLETFTWWNNTVLPYARSIDAQSNLSWEVYPRYGVESAPSSAVAWRRQVITTMMQVAFPISFKGTKTEKQIFELGEKGRALLRKGEKGEKLVYVNYANGDEPQEEMFGRANLERLRALKRKWDGRGVFGGYNPIRI